MREALELISIWEILKKEPNNISGRNNAPLQSSEGCPLKKVFQSKIGKQYV